MLAIRMQRTGRRGHAQFRLVVQDSRFSPSSGRVVAYLGSYDPHTKIAAFDKDKTSAYLKNGAQPSDRVARLLKKEGVKLPGWVELASPGKRSIRHPEKLRRNRPAEAVAAEPAEAEAAAKEPAESASEQTAETKVAETTDEAPAEEPTEASDPASEGGAATEAADADKS